MGLCKLRRVIPEQIRADVRLSGVIVGHCHMELRAAHCAMDAAVRLGGLLQFQRQDRADELVRLALGAQEISQRIGHKYVPPIGCGAPFGVLQDVRVGSDDHIRAPVGQRLS